MREVGHSLFLNGFIFFSLQRKDRAKANLEPRVLRAGRQTQTAHRLTLLKYMQGRLKRKRTLFYNQWHWAAITKEEELRSMYRRSCEKKPTTLFGKLRSKAYTNNRNFQSTAKALRTEIMENSQGYLFYLPL